MELSDGSITQILMLTLVQYSGLLLFDWPSMDQRRLNSSYQNAHTVPKTETWPVRDDNLQFSWSIV